MERSAFAGGDQDYLRDSQYRDTSNLDARTSLHVRFSNASVAFPDFVASCIEWRDGLDVLECGTGSGRLWDNPITPRSTKLTLTDLSAGMVEAAVERASANGFDVIVGQVCDVQELPFEDATFDVAVANHMLYHVPDPDRAVGELARILRPGGKLLASTNGYGHMGPINDILAEVFEPHGEALYEVFGIDSGEARLRRHFDAVSWHAYLNDLVVDDPAAVLAYCTSFPPGETADGQQRQRLLAAIEHRFDNGSLTIPTRSGLFVCHLSP